MAVVQPLPGIGDMIWHLPHIRAIAAHVGHPVTLIAKPRSHADQIFAAETTISDVFWLDRNPEQRRGTADGMFGWLRTIAALRARHFDAIYLLHHSKTIAMQAALAGIPARYGYGYGVQGWLINRPPRLPSSVLRLHPYDQATEWVRAAGMAMPDAEPRLPVTDAALQAVRARLHGTPVALGIGSSEPYKQWGVERFTALAEGLAARGHTILVLVGGPSEAKMAATLKASVHGATIVPAVDWSLQESAAALALSAFYVGNDTGALNMAAAVGVRSYGLFGAVPPFHHASRVVVISPPGGIAKSDGMARISVEQVLAAIDAAPGSRLV